MTSVINNDNYNLSRLVNRQTGEKFRVIKGRLEIMSIFEKILCYIFNPYRKQIQAEVKNVITVLVDKVNRKELQLQACAINTFIFEKIFPLNYALFDPQTVMSNEGVVRDAVLKEAERLREELRSDTNIQYLDRGIKYFEDRLRPPPPAPVAPPPVPVQPPKTGIWNWVWSYFKAPEKGKEAVEEPVVVQVEEKPNPEKEQLKWRKQELEIYREKLMRAFIGLRMNLSHRANVHHGGWSGAYFWRDYENGKVIGVYKPCDEDSHSPNSPKLYARIRFRVQKAFYDFFKGMGIDLLSFFHKHQFGKAHLAELSTRIMSEELHRTYLRLKHAIPDFHSESAASPNTQIIHVSQPSGLTNSGTGSFQIFLENAKELTEFLEIDKSYRSNLDETPEEFKKRLLDKNILSQYQLILILHYLACAQDPHAENILAVTNKKGQTELKAIDNEKGLSPLYPTVHELRRMMEDCNLPLGEEPMVPEIAALVEGLFWNMGTVIDRILNAYTDKDNYPPGVPVEEPAITQARCDHLYRRYMILRKVAKERIPLSQLMYLVHEAEQQNFLGPTSAQA